MIRMRYSLTQKPRFLFLKAKIYQRVFKSCDAINMTLTTPRQNMLPGSDEFAPNFRKWRTKNSQTGSFKCSLKLNELNARRSNTSAWRDGRWVGVASTVARVWSLALIGRNQKESLSSWCVVWCRAMGGCHRRELTRNYRCSHTDIFEIGWLRTRSHTYGSAAAAGFAFVRGVWQVYGS